jgi:hypothetical protein
MRRGKEEQTHPLEAPDICVRAIEEAFQPLFVAVHHSGSTSLVDSGVGFLVIVEPCFLSDGGAGVALEVTGRPGEAELPGSIGCGLSQVRRGRKGGILGGEPSECNQEAQGMKLPFGLQPFPFLAVEMRIVPAKCDRP